MAEQGKHLYFIKIAKGRSPVKVGRANNPSERLKNLQVASPYGLKLIGVLEGWGHTEPAWHYFLGHDRMRGEWFAWTKRVEETVKLALDGGDWQSAIAARENFSDYPEWFADSPLYELAR